MKEYTAGIYVSQGSYKSFSPSLINKEWNLDSMPVISLLGKADRQLGRLDMHSDYVPNINWFIQMHVRKEAMQSSKIEGIQTYMEETHTISPTRPFFHHLEFSLHLHLPDNDT